MIVRTGRGAKAAVGSSRIANSGGGMSEDEAGTMPATAAGEARKRAPAKTARAKAKPVRWSARRETIFLQTLAQTAKVAAAIRASKLSESNVYRHRQRSEAFRAKWAAALAEGFERLETMMLDRALNGVEKPIWYGGKQVGTMTEYSDRTALALLAQHRGSVRGTAVPTREMSVDEWRAYWERRLGGMRQRLRPDD
jgi:hypothetical protein